MSRPLVALLPLTWAASALAQPLPPSDDLSPAAQSLDPVVVIGGGQRLADAPYAASVIRASELRSAGPMVNLSEVAQRVPGLIVNQRQNMAQDLQISSRGFGARATFGVRGLRLVADGIPASMPDGQGQVAHFDLAAAERIEVLRGPFSALYGNSSGGVIAIFSKPVTQRQVELGIDQGSDGLRQQRLSLQAPLDGNFDISASLAKVEASGIRPQSAAQRQLANLRLGWQAGQDRLVWLLSNQDSAAQDPLGLDLAALRANTRQTNALALTYNTRKTVRQTQTGLSWTHDFQDAGPLTQGQLSGYWGSRGVVQFLAIAPTVQTPAGHGGGVVDFDRVYQGLDGRLTWRWDSLKLTTGLNAERQRDDRRGYLNFQGSAAAPTALGVVGAPRRNEINAARSREGYGQAEWRMAAAWTATAGLRAGSVNMSTDDRYLSNGNDSGQRSFDYATPVLGLRWAVQPGWQLHASAARGSETPTLGELAYTASGGGGGGFNTQLQAQTSRQVELGSKWRSTGVDGDTQGLGVDAALFWIDTHNEIGVQTNSGGRSAFQNVGRTQRHGAELAVSWRASAQWRTQTALTWLSARYRDSFLTCAGPPCNTPTQPVAAGNRIAGTQPFAAWTELVWRPRADVGSSGLGEAALEWRAMGRTAANDSNSQFAPGYGIVGLRWLQRWSVGESGELEGLLRLDNVFDHRYAGSVIVNEASGRFFEPAAGRVWQASLRWRQGF